MLPETRKRESSRAFVSWTHYTHLFANITITRWPNAYPMLVRVHTTITTCLQHWPSASWFGGVAQVSFPLHALLPWPNFWHLKQRRGFGIYGSTGTVMYPHKTITRFGRVGSRNVTTNVSVFFLPPELSLTEMLSILTTP